MDANIVVRLIDETRQGFNDIQRNLNGIDSSSKNLSKTMDGLKQAAASFAGVLASRQILDFVDTVQLMDNRLKLVTKSQEEVNTRFNELFKVAQNSRVPLNETVDLYSKLAQNQSVVGKTGSEITQVVEAFNAAMAISGTSGAAAAGAITQFAQAMSSGRLQGDEFRSIAEAVPKVLQVISERTGIAREDLKKLASDGFLNAKIVAQAMTDALPQLQAELATTSITVSQAMTQMRNEFTRLGREFLDTSGLSEVLVSAIQHITANSENLIPILKVAGLALAALAVYFAPIATAVGLATAAVIAFADVLGPVLKPVVDAAEAAIGGIIRTVNGFVAAIKAAVNLENPFEAFSAATKKYDEEAKKAAVSTNKVATETKNLQNTQKNTIPVSDRMQQLMGENGLQTKLAKDQYVDFINELKQGVELAKLDSRERNIQIQVNKAYEAEAKRIGKTVADISEDRKRQIREEVEALATQVEDEKKKTDERKKLQDDLIRKQEEYDRFIESSRTKNLEGLALYTSQVEKIERDYREGAIRDEEQFQAVIQALKDQYQNQNEERARRFRLSQLTAEQAYQEEVRRITEEYNAGLIRSEETKNILLEEQRIRYGKKFDDMARAQRTQELDAIGRYHKEIIDLETANRAGLIKTQEDFDAIRRQIEEKYRTDTVREYSSLYGLLTEKIQDFTGLNQKEFGLLRDTVKLVFGVDIDTLIKQAFAEFIKYVIGFRTAAGGEINMFTGIFQSIFGKSGSAQGTLVAFAGDGKGILGDFVQESGGIFGGLTSILRDVFSGGLSFIRDFVSGGLDLLISFGKGAGSLLSNIFSGIGSIFSGGGGGGSILDTVLDFGGSLLSGGGNILSSIGSGAMDLLSSIPGVGSIIGGAGDILSSIGSGAMDLLKNLPGISDITSSIGNLFTSSGGGGGLGVLSGIGSIFSIVSFFDSFNQSREKAGQRADAARSQALSQYRQSSQQRGQLVNDLISSIDIRTFGGNQVDSTGLPTGARLPSGFTGYQFKTAQGNIGRNINNAYRNEFPDPQLGLYQYLASGRTDYGRKGLAYNAGRRMNSALGGLINRPTMFGTANGIAVGGEMGTEAIMPLERTADGQLGVQGGNVNINFTVNTVDAKDMDRLLVEKRQFITNMVRSAIAEKGRSII